ncbi:MAG: methylaspartate mutase subunit S [Proteobacteria bacterium]|nr:methylaspartate mutase subunit S [Pseudomonadota bacterium]
MDMNSKASEKELPQGPVILLGVLKDIHNLGILILKHALERGGFHVVNAGAMLSQAELIGAAIETGARAILISSSYGMAALDAEGFRGKCEEAGLKDVLLYIGGNLSVSRQNRKWEDIEDEFKALGFDRVYQQNVMPAQFIGDLKHDLGVAA